LADLAMAFLLETINQNKFNKTKYFGIAAPLSKVDLLKFLMRQPWSQGSGAQCSIGR
jgi:hypothetical protein